MRDAANAEAGVKPDITVKINRKKFALTENFIDAPMRTVFWYSRRPSHYQSIVKIQKVARRDKNILPFYVKQSQFVDIVTVGALFLE